MEEIVFHHCYAAGWIGWGLAYFLFSPLVFVVCLNIASMLYGTDGAFFVYYNVAVTFNFWIAYVLNITLRQKRPGAMEGCGVLSYGLPDYNLVSVFTLTFVLGAVGLTHRIRVRTTTSVVFIMVGVLYTMSLWYNVHLSASQVLFSLSLSCFLSAFWFVMYYTFLIDLDEFLANIWFLRLFGANTIWSVKARV